MSKITQSIQPFLQLHFHGSGLRVAQKEDHLHRTRVDRDWSRVRDFIINYPLRVVRQMIHDEDVAASDFAVSDVPSIKDELPVNAMGGQL